MRQFYKWAKKRRDDRGSAIVIVIIAMAMIGILATTMLWMAYMNYMIKVADVRNKNGFYTAEEVVEQIMSGLRRESAAAVGVAYRDVLANWDNLDSEAARSNLFMTTYMDTLIEKFKHPTQGPSFYNREMLKSYVDADAFPSSRAPGSTNPGASVDETAWDNGGPAGETGEAVMEVVNNNSIILKNIYVSCTDAEDRVSIVKTDICLDVPKLIFENNGSIDSLYQYSLIGGEGIEMQTKGIINAQGSMYAGTDKDGKGGLTLGLKTEADGTKKKVGGTSLVLEDALRLISRGDIAVQGPSSALTVRDMPGEDNRIYAKNISLNSAAASLGSKVYVSNDLTLDGVGSRVALTKEYYGYGNSMLNGLPGEAAIDTAKSSAIIINGKDSTVDMSSVTRLLIAGRSYIGPRIGNNLNEEAGYTNPLAAPGPVTTRNPVMMGESIAVKGGQVAYLVPAECIGTVQGESVIGQNPLSADKISDTQEENEKTYGVGFQEVDFDREVYRLGGKKLRDVGVDDMDHIRKVYAPYNNGSLLYYYLVMDKETAEKYFVQYYNVNANREEVDAYFNRYLSGGFQLGDFTDAKTEYTILGNSLVSSALTDSGVTLLTSVDQTTLNPPPGTSGEGGAEGTTPGEGTDPAAPPIDPDAYTETGINAEEVKSDRTSKAVDDLIDQIQGEYRGLTYNLTDSPSVPPEVNPDSPEPADPDNPQPGEYNRKLASAAVFKSIIKCKVTGGVTGDNVEDYLDGLHVSHVTYTTTSGLKAYLTENDVTVSSIGSTSEVRLVVSLGDVTVDQDFTGLIIAKGKVTVTGAHNIKLGGTDLASVLEANSELWVNDGTNGGKGSGDLKKPIDLFKNGGGSLQNGAQAPTVDDAGNLALDYSEIVRYMNWIKK